MNLLTSAKLTETEARDWFEKLRWPNGPICPHCGSTKHKKYKKYKCLDCKKQYTVTVNTPLHKTQIPLNKWVFAIHLWSASKNNISSLELARHLDITQKTSWYMLHRIRLMARKDVGKLNGTVEADEVYTGDVLKSEKTGKRGRGTGKTPVLVLVEKTQKVKPSPYTPKNPYVGTGRVIAKPVEKANSLVIFNNLVSHVDSNSTIHTDEFAGYSLVNKHFDHHTVRHNYRKNGKKRREFVSESGVSNNTAESFNARVRRGIRGTYHHVSKKHLNRYCDEFAFRWNTRMLSDGHRAENLVKDMNSKKLRYADLIK